MKKIQLFTLVICSLLVGCSYSTHYIQSYSTAQPATSVDKIKIISGDIEGDYYVIGSIASSGVDTEDAVEVFKEEAAKIGADAVIFITLTKSHTDNGGRTGLSGTAISYKK